MAKHTARNSTPAARERKRRYRERHREELRAKGREYMSDRRVESAFREQERERIRTLQATNPEHKNAIQRKSYTKHAADRRERSRLYRLAHPDKVRESNRRRIADKTGAAYAAMLNANARRRARLRGAETEKIDRLRVYERDGGRCHICGRRCSVKSFHLDHLVPLAAGGSHTYANVATAHANCNLKRGAGRIPAQLRLEGGCPS